MLNKKNEPYKQTVQEKNGLLRRRMQTQSTAWSSGLERRNCNRHGRGLKPTCAIPLCPWERYLTALYLT